MAFDSIDQFFNDMLKKYSKFFVQEKFDPIPDLVDDDAVFDDESTKYGADDDYGPTLNVNKPSYKEIGYEIITGSGMKDPIIRIHGNPDDFPALKNHPENYFKLPLDNMTFQNALDDENDNTAKLDLPPNISPNNDVKEPYHESFNDKEKGTIVNVDLPGITASEVSVQLFGQNLLVEAYGETHHFKKTIPLEKKVNERGLKWHINNGVLEIQIPNLE